jgi:integrase
MTLTRISWVKRWGYLVASKPTRPGIYRLKDGGFLVRGRVTDAKTGKLRTVIKALRDATVQEAQAALDDAKAARREGSTPRTQLFSEFAASRYEAKLTEGRIKSAKGRQKWDLILRHQLVPVFGNLACDELKVWHLTQWREKLAGWMRDGYEYERTFKNGKKDKRKTDLSPRTANTWLSIMRVLVAEMGELLELPIRGSKALAYFDTSQRPTYTDEAPNALTPSQATRFLAEMERSFPQFYAMVLLALATGKRPSTLRPLRRCGPDADVDWVEGFVRFRRSHTLGAETMVGTKTGTSERVYLNAALLDVLRAHVVKWCEPSGAKTDLLFPSTRGGNRSPSCLDKPFAQVGTTIGLPFKLTPRAMRRTFQDLARAAQVHDVVTRSISGHATESMQRHYSTAQAEEQRQAVGSVLGLVVREVVRSVDSTTSEEQILQ